MYLLCVIRRIDLGLVADDADANKIDNNDKIVSYAI